MRLKKDTIEYLKQLDVRRAIETCFAGSQWIPVNSEITLSRDGVALFGELVRNDHVSHCLSCDGWDLMKVNIGPQCSISYDESGQEVVTYSRLGTPYGIEPIIVPRSFHGLLPDYQELIEEYRLFHQLFHDARNRTFVKLLESGNTETVARIEGREFQLKRRHLKEFLGIKGMSLIVQFDSIRYSPVKFSSIPASERFFRHHDEDFAYSLSICEDDMGRKNPGGSFSKLFGKCVIRGYAKEKCNFWPYENNAEVFPDFCIGVDDDGNEVFASCDPDFLDRKSPGARSYLTPVYFSRDVLQKYFADESKYSVEDGYLRCGSLWGLRMDNHNPDYIMVFLGDLSGDLPQDEREYWKAFNITPQGGMSRTAFMRNILGEFADPEKEDLRFKLEYERFNKLWLKTNGWPLFRPLHDDDLHVFKHLRIPINNVSSEFDQQILYLTKLLIDSLNEKQISRSVSSLPEDCKGITKLEILLGEIGYPHGDRFIQLLRCMQSVRSKGSAHRKGSSYEKSLKQLGVSKSDYIESFACILRAVIDCLADLARYIEG